MEQLVDHLILVQVERLVVQVTRILEAEISKFLDQAIRVAVDQYLALLLREIAAEVAVVHQVVQDQAVTEDKFIKHTKCQIVS